MPQDIFAIIEEGLNKLEEGLQPKKGGKTFDMEFVTRELKRIRSLINSNKDSLTEDNRRAIAAQQARIKVLTERLKPVIVLLKPQQKIAYRQEYQLLGVLRSVQKKVALLNEKKDSKKDTKKRQTNMQFFKFHQAKLTMLSEWLLSPSRKFSLEGMKSLMKYLNDLHISHDDSVFQDELKELYESIISFAEELVEITNDFFLSSFANKPRINDYLLSKQTKENTYRNSICPNYKMIDLSVIPKMSIEVLFFMFFFHKGETEQYLAAKQLMKKSWRYYTKFHMWIKRGQAPNFDVQNFETGNYFTVGVQLVVRQRKNIRISHKHLITKLDI